jgi:hypothetical protein
MSSKFTLNQVKDTIKKDYLEWFKTGKQYGVLNIVGPAGIGKTEGLHQICKDLQDNHGIPNAKITELYIPAASDPESVAGVPAPGRITVDGNEVPVLLMHYREEIVKAAASGRGGILFVDEWGREAQQLRPLMLKLLHEKSLAGFSVENLYLILARNPADDNHSGVESNEEDAAVSSRLTDIHVYADVEEVHNYFSGFTASHKAVADFLIDNPQFITGRDSDRDITSRYYCPRAWFNMAWKLHIHGEGKDDAPGRMTHPMTNALCAGTVGPNAFAEFKKFMSNNKPLTLQQILSGTFPKKIAIVPASTMQALKTHLASTPLTDAQADNVVKFMSAIHADLAASIPRGQLHVANLSKLTAKGMLTDFANRIGSIKPNVKQAK